jgi:cysteine desulfurase/selenocysteine lyase
LLRAETRLVAVTQCSNVTGAITDVASLVAAARRVGARVLLDGAQAVQHGPQDVQALGVDFYAFSGHKCFGPGGVGVLWARGELLAAMPPFLGGGGMIGEVSLDGYSWAGAAAPFRGRHTADRPGRRAGCSARLDAWPRLECHPPTGRCTLPGADSGAAAHSRPAPAGPARRHARAPIVSFDIDGLHPHDICQVLDHHGLALRGGHHCAQPLLTALGVESCTRASLALYNDEADVVALLDALTAAVKVLR